jgi:hypothetical protein
MPILKLEEGEIIQDCVSPGGDVWEVPVCRECGQVAYRMVVIESDQGSRRTVPLCGIHFINACLQLPELNQYNRSGKI